MLQKGLSTVLLLICSNAFMTCAWYGHLKLAQTERFSHLGVAAFIFISWSIALIEYCFQVPANRIGFQDNGGPFSLWQLKVIQEVITLVVFTLFTLIVFKNEVLRWNHLVGFLLLVGAVYFIFKK